MRGLIMKLLLIMPELIWGGAERQFRYLITEIEGGAVVYVMHSYSNQDDFDIEEKKFIEENGQSVYLQNHVKSNNRIKKVMALTAIVGKIIDKYGITSALVYEPDGCYMIPYLKSRKISVIYSERNSGEGVVNSRFLKHLVKRADYITANSKDASELLEKKLKRVVIYIKNGIEDIHSFLPKVGLCRNVLVPARIAPIKNQRLILEFLKKYKDWDGIIFFAGKNDDNDYENMLQNMIKDSKIERKVVFGGFCSEMDSIYKCSDVVVLPSYKEGMSNVILECFLRGIPIFVSRISMNVFTDYLEKFSFDPNSPEELMECFVKWDKLPFSEKERVLIENFEYVIKEHSISKMVKEYSKLILL